MTNVPFKFRVAVFAFLTVQYLCIASSSVQLREEYSIKERKLLSWFHGKKSKTEDAKNSSILSFNEPGTIYAVLNTPRMGPGTFQQSFLTSLDCGEGMKIPGVDVHECDMNQTVIRSNGFGASSALIHKHRRNYPDGRCHIVTSLRSPTHWFASRFEETSTFQGAQCRDIEIPLDDALREYKSFLITRDFGPTFYTLNSLLNEYRVRDEYRVSLTSQFQMMDKNGGYSIIGPAPEGSIIAGCELLFLRMEESESWPDIFETVFTGIKFALGEARLEQCPHAAATLNALKDYEFTKAEIKMMTRDGGLIEEWLYVYGYENDFGTMLEPSTGTMLDSSTGPVQESSTETVQDVSIFSFKESGTIYGVINAFRVDTGALQNSFLTSFGCDEETVAADTSRYNCDMENTFVTTNHGLHGILVAFDNHAHEYPNGRCHIISILRSPVHWLAASYAVTSSYCSANEVLTVDIMREFKEFIGRNTNLHMVTRLFSEYRNRLGPQARLIDKHGYAVVRSKNNGPAITDCNLLLLKAEDSKRWPDIVERVFPGLKYTKEEPPLKECPRGPEIFKKLEDYKLTNAETEEILSHGNLIVKDWFDAYGYVDLIDNLSNGTVQESSKGTL